MANLDYVQCVAAESARFREAVTAPSLALAVPACPGWSVRDLADHVGYVQRWARLAMTTGAQPDDAAIDAPPHSSDADDLRAWLAAGADALCSAMSAVEPDAPTWHPFPVPKVAAVWPRRQAHEIAIHRWDIERAVGLAPTPLDVPFAVDFVHEYFGVVVPRVIDRDERTAPTGRLRVVLTDTDESFVVVSMGTDLAISEDDGAVDATVAGTAEEVLLALWKRQSLPTPIAESLAIDWLAFGGN